MTKPLVTPDLPNGEVSLACGADSVRFAFKQELSTRGFRVNPRACVKLILDVPRGYAMRVLEEMHDTDYKRVVVTWNSCPEHLEDLRELQPEALLSHEFFLRQDLDDALSKLLELVHCGNSYDFVPGTRTVLTPPERAVLRYAACGWTNRRISKQLCIAEQTVKNRLRTVYSKLNICNHAQAVLYYWEITQPFE